MACLCSAGACRACTGRHLRRSSHEHKYSLADRRAAQGAMATRMACLCLIWSSRRTALRRSSPCSKYRIVELLMERGHTVRAA